MASLLAGDARADSHVELLFTRWTAVVLAPLAFFAARPRPHSKQSWVFLEVLCRFLLAVDFVGGLKTTLTLLRASPLPPPHPSAPDCGGWQLYQRWLLQARGQL